MHVDDRIRIVAVETFDAVARRVDEHALHLARGHGEHDGVEIERFVGQRQPHARCVRRGLEHGRRHVHRREPVRGGLREMC